METVVPSGYSAKFPILAGTSPMSEWGINSTCVGLSGLESKIMSLYTEINSIPSFQRKRVGMLGEPSETSPDPVPEKVPLGCSGSCSLTARDSGVSQLCRQLLAEALGLRRLECGSQRWGSTRRDPRRVFPARCRAGRKDIPLAELTAQREWKSAIGIQRVPLSQQVDG